MNKREKLKLVCLGLGAIIGIPPLGLWFDWPGIIVQLAGMFTVIYFAFMFDTEWGE